MKEGFKRHMTETHDNDLIVFIPIQTKWSYYLHWNRQIERNKFGLIRDLNPRPTGLENSADIHYAIVSPIRQTCINDTMPPPVLWIRVAWIAAQTYRSGVQIISGTIISQVTIRTYNASYILKNPPSGVT